MGKKIQKKRKIADKWFWVYVAVVLSIIIAAHSVSKTVEIRVGAIILGAFVFFIAFSEIRYMIDELRMRTAGSVAKGSIDRAYAERYTIAFNIFTIFRLVDICGFSWDCAASFSFTDRNGKTISDERKISYRAFKKIESFTIKNFPQRNPLQTENIFGDNCLDYQTDYPVEIKYLADDSKANLLSGLEPSLLSRLIGLLPAVGIATAFLWFAMFMNKD
jgi:hypothetical protein